ncbi:MAG TPA: DUF1990 domain-containing protein [Actinophytocola sp.]|uniref:DUF1990 family protein n=1 Tax=Actinophytocola sp. TaxID=1872138 RepID=UPI002DDDAF78|nr:DUF1990 domain-containing protein [Actinophytocola sp.]HEV2779007.1 DUF1990 domain-containing protein [Actinophytocola sp.]
MAIERLAAERVAELRAARLTYPEVGRTAGTMPQGYRSVNRTRRLPAGTDFDTVTHDLLHWQAHRRAGLRVAASGDRATPDAVVELSIGIGWLAVRAPCRVVYVVDEPRRRGFAYGTLPGHPESGEELFLLERHDDGSVTFTITAFSRPASALAKLAGPLGRRIQDAVTDRYVRALGAGARA